MTNSWTCGLHRVPRRPAMSQDHSVHRKDTHQSPLPAVRQPPCVARVPLPPEQLAERRQLAVERDRPRRSYRVPVALVQPRRQQQPWPQCQSPSRAARSGRQAVSRSESLVRPMCRRDQRTPAACVPCSICLQTVAVSGNLRPYARTRREQPASQLRSVQVDRQVNGEVWADQVMTRQLPAAMVGEFAVVAGGISSGVPFNGFTFCSPVTGLGPELTGGGASAASMPPDASEFVSDVEGSSTVGACMTSTCGCFDRAFGKAPLFATKSESFRRTILSMIPQTSNPNRQPPIAM